MRLNFSKKLGSSRYITVTKEDPTNETWGRDGKRAVCEEGAGAMDGTNSTATSSWQERMMGWCDSFWAVLLQQLHNQFLGGSIALGIAGPPTR